mgnify:CR=1 FL=1
MLPKWKNSQRKSLHKTGTNLQKYILKNISLTIGANNLFDIYPDETKIGGNRGAGYFVYSRTGQQFGTGGRFAFARLSLSL